MRVTVTVILDDGEVATSASVLAKLKDLGFVQNMGDEDGRSWAKYDGRASVDDLAGFVSMLEPR